ncbi:hypothetical protein [Porphyromonas sp. HMSC077F02]|uniref:hypothetical protein n=1 Tax=Porphyromonas sp. HMSC077F02 TaxID=1739529 RepID=UPI0014396047|nr:hypothetical protein [Porphyromonas sp. HMSC077F02]
MKQNKKYEAPTLSVEEVRIEKAFLAQATASGNVQDESEPGLNPGGDGDISDLFG